MSLTAVLAEVAPNVSNEILGKVVQAFDPDALGASLRPLLGNFEPVATEVATSGNAKSAELPESSVARAALMATIYGSFEKHRRRSTGALSRVTGLTPEAVVMLIDDNTDFRMSTGRNSGKTYVSRRAT